jgi:hypothetical protein
LAVESRRSEMSDERQQWESQRAELLRMIETPTSPANAVDETETSPEIPLTEPPFEAPAEHKPVDLAEVFRRVGATVEMEDEEPVSGMPATPTERPTSIAHQPPAQSATPNHTESEEESIDDYMGRLMQRVKAGGPPSKSAGNGAPVRPSTPAVPAAAVKPSAAESEEAPSGPIQPRSAAPETHNDLSALRELANLSAHSALNHHSRQLLVYTMRSKLTVAIVALAAGGAMFWMWKGASSAQMTYYAGLIAVLVAVYWGVQYALLSGRLTISRSGHIDIATPTSVEVEGKNAEAEKSPAEIVGMPVDAVAATAEQQPASDRNGKPANRRA